jgi:adenylate cyclase
MDALTKGSVFLFEGFRLDRQARALFRCDEAGAFVPIAIGSRALEVLGVLVGRAGDLIPRDEFMAAVWPATAVEDTNLNMQIAALRRILDEGRADRSCIQTIPGRGYRFVVPVAQTEAAMASSFVTDGNGNAGPIATGGLVSPRSVECGTDHLTPIPTVTRPWPRRSIMAAMAVAALCLFAAAIAAVNWRLHAPWEARSPSRPSIIVLPFASLNRDSNEQRLSDAVTADVTTDLSRIWDIVISRDIASTYREKAADAKQIGRELGVRYVLEGSIQRSDDRVEVNFELVDAETGAELRADRFDAGTAQATEIRKEITGRIARTLTLALADVERPRIEHERPGDVSARDLVMLGWARFNHADANKAEVQALFERALEIDPQSEGARLGLARLLIDHLAYPKTSAFEQTEARIAQLLSEALTIGGHLAQTHATTGLLRRVQNRLTESRTELEMAIALDESNSWAYYELGVTLMYLGQPEAGIPYIERATRLNPSHPSIASYYWALGASHLLMSHIEEAVELLQRSRAANPRPFFVHEWLAAALGLKGDLEEARTALAEMTRIKPELTSLKQIRIHYPWGINPEHLALRVKTIDLGLRRAGLPDE